MSDTLHAEAPLANSPEARTTTGELKDQTQPLIPEKTEEPPKVEDKKEEAKVEDKKDDKAKSKESLLNKKEDSPPGAPEKYEPFKAPAGYELNAEVIGKAEGIFKELGLNQESAQRLVDFYAENAAKAADAPYAAYEAQRETWQNEVKADPEIGNKLPAVKETIGRALALLNDQKMVDSFKEAMDVTGVGDHPAFIRAFYKLASLVTEGKHVTGGNPSPQGQTGPNAKPKSMASAIFPNLPSAG